jgi:gamma-glutamylcyclotransferase
MEDIVHGVLFEIPEAQRGKLDAAEGYRLGYEHAEIQVHLPDGTTESALAYVADFTAIDEEKMPYNWYHELVVAGAEQHALPDGYIAKLREERSVNDPQPDRDSKVEAEKVLSEYYATRKRT